VNILQESALTGYTPLTNQRKNILGRASNNMDEIFCLVIPVLEKVGLILVVVVIILKKSWK
jgi:hypothetical protein